MANIVKTVVATGASSGIGFEAIKQLLAQSQRHRIIVGARNPRTAQAAYDELKIDPSKDTVMVLPLELADLTGVKTFAQKTLEKLGSDKIDYLLLNAAISDGAEKPGPRGLKWCEAYIVNHLSQHFLTHLLRDKLVSSGARIIVVSSGAITSIKDPDVLDNDLRGCSGVPGTTVYSETKFTQLLGAHWWRRQLRGQCVVVAVSPGLVPNTNLGSGAGVKFTMDMPDAKTVPQGAASVLRAFTRDDFPEDPDQIFLTSWGEWWSKDVLQRTLDKKLQDKWSPSKDEIEDEEWLAARAAKVPFSD